MKTGSFVRSTEALTRASAPGGLGDIRVVHSPIPKVWHTGGHPADDASPERAADTPAPTWSGRGRGASLAGAISGSFPAAAARRRGGARRHPFTSLAPPTGAPLMRLAIKRRASGPGRGVGPSPGRAGRDGAPGGRAPTAPRAAPGPWRKRGRCGPPRCSSCSPASRTPWAWATCGASRTCARCTAEVSARPGCARPATPARAPSQPGPAPRLVPYCMPGN